MILKQPNFTRYGCADSECPRGRDRWIQQRKRQWAIAVAICVAAIIYLILTSGPQVYSFQEIDRATATCGKGQDDCVGRELVKFRNDFPNDPSIGSR